MLFFAFRRVKLICFSYAVPLCWLVHTAFVYIYSDQLIPGNGVSFCVILAWVFFCYVSDKVVSFNDSIPMRDVA